MLAKTVIDYHIKLDLTLNFQLILYGLLTLFHVAELIILPPFFAAETICFSMPSELQDNRGWRFLKVE